MHPRRALPDVRIARQLMADLLASGTSAEALLTTNANRHTFIHG
jgi:hypothetical protein